MGHIEEVAARLKGLREALGLSVADVCAACGIEEENTPPTSMAPQAFP